MATHTLIVHSTAPSFQNRSDEVRYKIPARSLALADLNSTVVLPNTPELKKLVEFYETVLWQAKLDCIWTDDLHFEIDVEIDKNEEIKAQLSDRSSRWGDSIQISSYSPNKYTSRWVASLGVDVEPWEESPAFRQLFRHKRSLHRSMSTLSTPALVEEAIGVRVPKGYICATSEELVQAYWLLKEEGIENFILKPLSGSGGRGITPISDVAQLQEEVVTQAVILEERLSLDYNELTGCERNCSVQFLNGEIYGTLTSQLLDGVSWHGALVPSVESYEFQQDVFNQSKAMLELFINYKMKGMGGLDFLSSGGKAYLVDSNLGRYTGIHFGKKFASVHAPKMAFSCQQFPTFGNSVFELWKLLERDGLNFNRETQWGVFPLVHLPNLYTMMIAFADSSAEALELIQQAKVSILWQPLDNTELVDNLIESRSLEISQESADMSFAYL